MIRNLFDFVVLLFLYFQEQTISTSQWLKRTEAYHLFVLHIHRGSASGGQWLGLGWFCLILSSLREAGQQWNSLDSVAQGRHSMGGCALALKTCLPPESVSFLLWSHSIDQSKSHGISDFKEVRSADRATCMKGGNPCR